MQQRSTTDRRQDNGQDKKHTGTDQRQGDRRKNEVPKTEKNAWETSHPNGHAGHPYS